MGGVLFVVSVAESMTSSQQTVHSRAWMETSWDHPSLMILARLFCSTSEPNLPKQTNLGNENTPRLRTTAPTSQGLMHLTQNKHGDVIWIEVISGSNMALFQLDPSGIGVGNVMITEWIDFHGD